MSKLLTDAFLRLSKCREMKDLTSFEADDLYRLSAELRPDLLERTDLFKKKAVRRADDEITIEPAEGKSPEITLLCALRLVQLGLRISLKEGWGFMGKGFLYEALDATEGKSSGQLKKEKKTQDKMINRKVGQKGFSNKDRRDHPGFHEYYPDPTFDWHRESVNAALLSAAGGRARHQVASLLKTHLPKNRILKGHLWPPAKVLIAFKLVLKKMPSDEQEGFLISLATFHLSSFRLKVELSGDYDSWRKSEGKVFAAVFSVWGKKFVEDIAQKHGEELKKVLLFKRS